MKRLVLILLVMMFSFVGCSVNDSPETQENEIVTEKEYVSEFKGSDINTEKEYLMAFKNYLKAVEDGDSDLLLYLLSVKDTDNIIAGNQFHIDYIDDYLKDTNDGITKKFGKFKYEIENAEFEELDVEEFEVYFDNLVDCYDEFEAPNVEECYVIRCNLIIDGEKRVKNGRCKVVMVKENGKWVVWDLETDIPCANIDDL